MYINNIIFIVIKYNFIPKEEIDSIIESELEESAKQIEKLKIESGESRKQNDEMKTQIKLMESQKEGLNQKLDILQKSLEEASKTIIKKG